MLFGAKTFGKVSYEKGLGWWADIGKTDFSNLKIIAFSVYGAFPSSAESEREFSTAGKDATAARSRLGPAFVHIISYLSLNAQRLREFTRTTSSSSKSGSSTPRRGATSSSARRFGLWRETTRRLRRHVRLMTSTK
jgi:hypothetical protein